MRSRYEVIADMVNSNGWESGAEIGLFNGRTFFYLLDHCPKLRSLVGADVWDTPGFKEGPTKSGEKCYCEFCNETRTARKMHTVAEWKSIVIAKSREYGDRCMVYNDSSIYVSKFVGNGTLDFVFIDGDHSKEGVMQDVYTWYPKIKKGGLMIGHDFNMDSVRQGIRFSGLPQSVLMGIKSLEDHLWVIPC